ncbi:unnamed protein product [Alopecurus aequalis]
MDSSSWIHGNAGGGYTAFQYMEQEQVQQQQQHELLISVEMNINNQHCSSMVDGLDLLGNSYHATSSSISSSFSRSPETSSTAAHVLMAPASTGLHFPDVPLFVAHGGVVLLPYEDQYVANFHDTPAAGGMSSTSAFRRYERHFGPQRMPTKPACGQSMFKTAMSVLDKMHKAMRYGHQQQEASAAEPPGNKLQNMIAERKRRGKINDCFRALKAVLPPGSNKKLGKTSMLIGVREYVNSLKSKVCELEEKNKALESQLALCATSAEEDVAGQKVHIQMTRAAAGEDRPTSTEACTVNIATPGGGNTTGMVLRILQRLEDQMGDDVSLASMSNGEDGDRPHRENLTLHLKLASGVTWQEETVREAVWSEQVRGINLHHL